MNSTPLTLVVINFNSETKKYTLYVGKQNYSNSIIYPMVHFNYHPGFMETSKVLLGTICRKLLKSNLLKMKYPKVIILCCRYKYSTMGFNGNHYNSILHNLGSNYHL